MSDDDWGDDDGGDDDAGWGDDDDAGDDGGDGGWGSGDDDIGDDDDDDGEVDDSTEIENQYERAKDMRRGNPEKALELFLSCVKLETEKLDHVFKRFSALHYIILLQFGLGKLDEVISTFEQLLSYAQNPGVTKNDLSDAVSAVLAEAEAVEDPVVMDKVYDVALKTLKQLDDQSNLWFKTGMSLCTAQFNRGQVEECKKRLEYLHSACRNPDGSDDFTKGTQLLEIYSIEIQLYKEKEKLKELFKKTKDLSGDINDPRSMSVIRECWGKYHASLGKWGEAFTEFWDAFLNYQEIGHDKAKQCLKYVVIANLLSNSPTNPFDAREAKVFENSPEIAAVVSLRVAYEDNDIRAFDKVMRKHGATLTNDPFIRQNVDGLYWRVRCQALLKLIKPYKRLKLSYIGQFLNVKNDEAEKMCVSLILDDQIRGKVDQVAGVLDLNPETAETRKFDALDKWAENVKSLEAMVTSKAGIGGKRGRGMEDMMELRGRRGFGGLGGLLGGLRFGGFGGLGGGMFG